MPVVLDPTPGGSAANTYAALAAYVAYAAGAGVTVAPADPAGELVQATQRLDLEIYVGAPTSSAQALQWPRTGALDPDRSARLVVPPTVDDWTGDFAPGPAYTLLDAATIPRRVAIATMELALAIRAGADLRAVDDTRNVKSEQVDVIKTEYVAQREPTDALTRYPAVWRAIAPLVVTAIGDAAAQLAAAQGGAGALSVPLPRPALDPARYATIRAVRGSRAGG